MKEREAVWRDQFDFSESSGGWTSGSTTVGLEGVKHTPDKPYWKVWENVIHQESELCPDETGDLLLEGEENHSNHQ